MQQQRHPGLIEEIRPNPIEPDDAQLVASADDDGELALDKTAMDQARGLSAVARGYALNESSGRDLLPGL